MTIDAILAALSSRLGDRGFVRTHRSRLTKTTAEGWVHMIEVNAVGVKVPKLRGRIAVALSVHAPEVWKFKFGGSDMDFLRRMHSYSPGRVATHFVKPRGAIGVGQWLERRAPKAELVNDIMRPLDSQGKRFFRRYGEHEAVILQWERRRAFENCSDDDRAMIVAALLARRGKLGEAKNILTAALARARERGEPRLAADIVDMASRVDSMRDSRRDRIGEKG